jgi:hypothetical protein
MIEIIHPVMQKWRLYCLELTMITILNSLDYLVEIIKVINRFYKEEINVFRDLSWDRPNPRPILEDPPRQLFLYKEEVIGEDEL